MRKLVVPLIVLLVAGGLFLLRHEGSPLTPEALAAAKERWSREGPRSYDLDLEVGGTQRGEHHIEVRDGCVVAMTTGGVPAPEHVHEYWTVEGMFRFLQTELGNTRRPREAYGVDDPSAVTLWADFDPQTGLPRYFLRDVRGKNLEIHWEVVRFEKH